MFGLGFTELIIVLIVALLVFGPKNLPQIGKALGKGIHEFKKAVKGAYDDESISATNENKDNIGKTTIDENYDDIDKTTIDENEDIIDKTPIDENKS